MDGSAGPRRVCNNVNENGLGDPWTRAPLGYTLFSRFLFVNDKQTNSSLPKGSQGLPPKGSLGLPGGRSRNRLFRRPRSSKIENFAAFELRNSNLTPKAQTANALTMKNTPHQESVQRLGAPLTASAHQDLQTASAETRQTKHPDKVGPTNNMTALRQPRRLGKTCKLAQCNQAPSALHMLGITKRTGKDHAKSGDELASLFFFLPVSLASIMARKEILATILKKFEVTFLTFPGGPKGSRGVP